MHSHQPALHGRKTGAGGLPNAPIERNPDCAAILDVDTVLHVPVPQSIHLHKSMGPPVRPPRMDIQGSPSLGMANSLAAP